MIYVTQEPPPGVNILGAKEFGDFKVLSSLKMQSAFMKTEEMVNDFKHQLQMFNDNDYILPMGDPAIIGIATAIASNYNEGRVKFLKWDRQERVYYVWSVQLGKRIKI